eukprot:572314-Pyramimonas_sp.AAC.1
MSSEGHEPYIKRASLYAEGNITGNIPGVTNEKSTFQEVAERALVHGDVAIGLRENGKVVINPARDHTVDMTKSEVIVLSLTDHWDSY